jgi:hypothetical protein
MLAGGNCVLNTTQTISRGAKLTIQPDKNLIIQATLSTNNF